MCTLISSFDKYMIIAMCVYVQIFIYIYIYHIHIYIYMYPSCIYIYIYRCIYPSCAHHVLGPFSLYVTKASASEVRHCRQPPSQPGSHGIFCAMGVKCAGVAVCLPSSLTWQLTGGQLKMERGLEQNGEVELASNFHPIADLVDWN